MDEQDMGESLRKYVDEHQHEWKCFLTGIDGLPHFSSRSDQMYPFPRGATNAFETTS